MLNSELTNNQKIWSEYELLERLKRKEFNFPSVEMRLVETPTKNALARVDGVLDITWQQQKCRFLFEYKMQSTPKSLETAMAQVQRYAKEFSLSPMVIVPYLPEKSIRLLEAEGISGIDLSGNGIILAPNFAVQRSGQPNRFKESAAIRNIFWGNSSLLARCFLLQPEYSSLNQLREFALRRFHGARENRESILTKGTVSKVTRALEEENIITRMKKGLKLTDSRALLERLKSNYRKSSGKRLEGKMSFNNQEAWEKLSRDTFRAVVNGDRSAAHYRVLSGQDKLTLYVDDLERAGQSLEVTPGALFPNVELIEEKNDIFYFDARLEGKTLWASPIQTWIELSLSGPREREAAEQLEAILRIGEGATL